MASSATSSPSDALPQYGFGPELGFDVLVQHNPFIFRVYTPKSSESIDHNPAPSKPYFVGQKFDETYALTAEPLPTKQCIDASSSYDDVVGHMDWTRRSSSPYISTSFSFTWSIWEALRRYHLNLKHDVEIAVIDGRALSECRYAVTAVQLLRKCRSKERHRDHWKWYRFSQESQSVLVYGSVPGDCVLTSIPLLSILDKLPSYFLHKVNEDAIILADHHLPLGRVAWDYTHPKHSYHQFCKAMSQRFLLLTVEERLRDTTVGSVRLAIAFLRPWFSKTINSPDLERATNTLCELANAIAVWPGQWWARSHTEMRDLIRAMVMVLGEEIQYEERQKDMISKDLQNMTSTLERVMSEYEARMESLEKPHNTARSLVRYSSSGAIDDAIRFERDGDNIEIYESVSSDSERASSPYLGTPPAKSSHLLVEQGSALPMSEEPEDSPTTPPASLAQHIFISRTVLPNPTSYTSREDVPLRPFLPIPSVSLANDLFDDQEESDICEPAPSSSNEDSGALSPLSPQSEVAELTTAPQSPVTDTSEEGSVLSPSNVTSTALPLEPEYATPPQSPLTDPSDPSKDEETDCAPSLYAKGTEEVHKSDSDNSITIPDSPTSEDAWELSTTDSTEPRYDMLETASYLVTCFLFGTFVTLCILSPHRRTLHLT